MTEVDHLAAILGRRVGKLPTIYLGITLGAKSKSKGIWNGVIEILTKIFLGKGMKMRKFHQVKWEEAMKSKKGEWGSRT